jgi:hypothetical protein
MHRTETEGKLAAKPVLIGLLYVALEITGGLLVLGGLWNGVAILRNARIGLLDSELARYGGALGFAISLLVFALGLLCIGVAETLALLAARPDHSDAGNRPVDARRMEMLP